MTGWTERDEQLLRALTLARSLKAGWRPTAAGAAWSSEDPAERCLWSLEHCELLILAGENVPFHTLGTKPGGSGASYVVTPAINYFINRRLTRKARERWLATSQWAPLSRCTIHLTNQALWVETNDERVAIPHRFVTAVARKRGGVVVEVSQARDWIPFLTRALFGQPGTLEHDMETWLGIRSGRDDWLTVAAKFTTCGEIAEPQVDEAFYARAAAAGRTIPPRQGLPPAVAAVGRALAKPKKKPVPWERSVTDRRIAGVAGGLAKRYGVSSTLVRAGFILSASPLGLFMGTPMYLLCWLTVRAERPGNPRPEVKVGARMEPPDANLTEVPDLDRYD